MWKPGQIVRLAYWRGEASGKRIVIRESERHGGLFIRTITFTLDNQTGDEETYVECETRDNHFPRPVLRR